jgi:hypothetical protein
MVLFCVDGRAGDRPMAKPALDRSVSEHTLCVEMYANKIIDGKGVVVARNTWDRACWLVTQQVIARIFAGVAALPEMSDRDDEVRVH